MRFDKDTWEEIIVTITRNKTRSFLTAFGVFWGIFMLTVLMGAGSGFQQYIGQQFKGFATNSAFLITDNTNEAYKGFLKGRYWQFSTQDIDRVKQIDGVGTVTGTLYEWGKTLTHGDWKTTSSLVGAFPEYERIQKMTLAAGGRFINEIDLKEHRKVCILGKKVADNLFPGEEDIAGEKVYIDGNQYTVIGVDVGKNGININGNNQSLVTVPYTTLKQTYNEGDQLDYICYTDESGTDGKALMEKIKQLLKKVHTISPTDEEAIRVIDSKAMFAATDSLFKGIRLLILLVGLGTLLAGIIGVSNIMMVTVKERTSEIGIRRAIGARPKDILRQIITESIVLTIIAGCAGLTFSVLILQMVETGVNYSGSGETVIFQISFWEAVLTTLMLIVLGVLAGLAPALRAMHIRAIEAIRDDE